jgi:hypothetical protein
VLSKLSRLHGELHYWNDKVLRKPQKRIRQAQKCFDEAMLGPMTAEKEEIVKEMKALIDLLLEQEETHWMQLSRANWLRQGDRNTLFFHNYATVRRKKNFIKKLKGEGDQWLEGMEALKPLIFQYFSNLFSYEVNELDPEVLEKIQPRVSQELNEKLLAPFSAEDVKKAALSIGDFKAPGPDGLHAVFYKFFWNMCGEEITHEVLQALDTGIIPSGWNDTTVVLIPKVDDLELGYAVSPN